MRNKFFTKDGWLTPYALACGYRHQTEVRHYHVVLEENNRECNTYQVRSFNNHAWDKNEWIVVEGIKAARNVYKQLCYMSPDKRYENARDIQRQVYA